MKQSFPFPFRRRDLHPNDISTNSSASAPQLPDIKIKREGEHERKRRFHETTTLVLRAGVLVGHVSSCPAARPAAWFTTLRNAADVPGRKAANTGANATGPE